MSGKRIWELDALRGLCVLCMILLHFLYDLTALWMLVPPDYPAWVTFLMNRGGILFLLISGISATFSCRSRKRGAQVFACGMLCTAATLALFLAGFPKSILIYFGTLHCLGLCMMLWPTLEKLSALRLSILALLPILLGQWLKSRSFSFPWLLPLGFVPRGFATSDYFPLFPNLGFFLLGAALGKILYPGKLSLLPQFPTKNRPIRLLTFCGRHALPLYLLHQPVLAGICGLWAIARS